MIEVRKTTVYRGPNVWARMPVILMVVDIGELEDRPSNKIPGFYEHLTELLPSLYDHGCSLGRPGGFLQRMREGTWMGHILEHLALELQNLSGAEVGRGKTRSTGERGHGRHQKRVWATVTSQTSDISVDVAANKELTNRLLGEVGIPVPRSQVVRNVDDAVRAANRIRYPVVIKPLD